MLPATQCYVARGTVLCCPRHSFMLPAAQFYVARGTVLCCLRHRVLLHAAQCYVARETALCCPWKFYVACETVLCCPWQCYALATQCYVAHGTALCSRGTVLCCPWDTFTLPLTMLCCPRHSVLLPATQCYVARGTVFCWPRQSVMLPAAQCFVGRGRTLGCPRHSVLLAAKKSEVRKLGILNCALLACGPNFAEVDRWSGAEWFLKVDTHVGTAWWMSEWLEQRHCAVWYTVCCSVTLLETLYLFNPIRPVCSFTYRQVKHSQILRSAHTAVFMCFVWIWEQTAIISLYSINWLVCITEMEYVYGAVRTGCLTFWHRNLTFKF
jgi:hypothetical protein